MARCAPAWRDVVLAFEPELNARWLAVTQRVRAIQNCLQQQLAEAGAKAARNKLTDSVARRPRHLDPGVGLLIIGAQWRAALALGAPGTSSCLFESP
jgi:hypothetical protein